MNLIFNTKLLPAIVFLSMALLLSTGVSAQQFLKIANENPDKKFVDIVKEVEAYYASKDLINKQNGRVVKDNEYIQYQRWKEFNKSRLTADGKLQNLNKHLLSESSKYTAARKGQRLAATTANWTSLGPTSTNVIGSGYSFGIGRVNCVAVDPANASIIYAGTPAGGLWRSTNGGTSWSPLTDSYLATVGVSAILIDPTSPATNRKIFIISGDADGGSTGAIGILRSVDNGNTWTSVYDIGGTSGNKLLIHPTNSQIIFAFIRWGVLKSTDGGNTWNIKFNNINGNLYDGEFKPGDPNIMYTVSDSKVYRSTNMGESWSEIAIGDGNNWGRKVIGVSPNNPNYVYLLDGSNVNFGSYGGVYRSTDSGLSFTLRSNTPNILGYSPNGDDASSQSWYDLAIAVNPNNAEEVHTGGISAWKSTNGGSSFTYTSNWYYPSDGASKYTHADIHALEYFGTTLYCGSDGGVYKTTDNAANWSSIYNGLAITQIYTFDVDPTNSSRVVLGAQDNGMNLLSNKVLSQWYGADGFSGFFDYTNPGIIYGEIQNGGLLKYVQSENTVYNVNAPESGPWHTPFMMDPVDHNTIYAGTNNYLYKSTNQGNSWTNISSDWFSNGPVFELAVAPSNTQFIYAFRGMLAVTKNGGATWEHKVLPNNVYATSITVNPTNANEVWVTNGSGIANNQVYKSLDAGTTWINMTGTLPNVQTSSIAINKNNNSVYVANDLGIFYRDNSMTDWIKFSTGLPQTIFNEVKIHYGTNKLFASSYGRGMWTSDLYSAGNTAPTVKITVPVNNAVYNTPANVTLTAEASDLDGTVTKVEFYNGTTKLGEDLTAPYTYQWNAIPVGSYQVKAVATDNSNASATSVIINFSVQQASNNLALNKPVVVSSTEDGTTPASFAVDGNLATRWSSLFADPQYIQVDLAGNYSINRVKISWEGAYGKDYKIQLSNDAVTWSDIKVVTNNTTLVNDWTGLSGTGRYIRMYGTSRGTPYGYSIYEFEVYGTNGGNTAPAATITSPSNNASFTAPASVSIAATATDNDGTVAKVEFYNGTTKIGEDLSSPYNFTWQNVAVGTYVLKAIAYDNLGAQGTSNLVTISVSTTENPNLALNKPTTTSSIETGTTVGSLAVDGSLTTRWSSLFADPQWIYVDLLQSYSISRVKITWEGAYGKDYKIQTSNDAISWTDLKVVSNNTVLTNDWTSLSGSGRYVRVYGTVRGTPYGYSIYELEVYGSSAINNPPTATLTSPANGSSYTTPASVALAADAFDSDGTIAKVEFYNGTTKIGEDLSFPYSFTWQNVTTGTYVLKAVAIDNAGAQGTSGNATITVNPVGNVNLALNKVTFTSSNETDATLGSFAVDGNAGTRWSSVFADPQWIYVDLTKSYNINRVKITWEAAYGKNYKLQVSNDAVNWTDFYTVTFNADLVNDWSGISGIGRYIRVYGTARGTTYGYSIFELEVYGNATPLTASAPIKIIDQSEEESADKDYVLYPNPAADHLTIDLNKEADVDSYLQITVSDKEGKMLMLVHKAEGNNSVKINTQYLENGTYFINIKKGKVVTTTKSILIVK